MLHAHVQRRLHSRQCKSSQTWTNILLSAMLAYLSLYPRHHPKFCSKVPCKWLWWYSRIVIIFWICFGISYSHGLCSCFLFPAFCFLTTVKIYNYIPLSLMNIFLYDIIIYTYIKVLVVMTTRGVPWICSGVLFLSIKVMSFNIWPLEPPAPSGSINQSTCNQTDI